MTALATTENHLAIRSNFSKTIELLPVTASTSIDVARRNCVGQLSKHGKQLGTEVIEVMVAFTAEFFGAKFSDVQIKETARLLYENYYWFDVVEFKVAMDRVKMQHYEKLFGHLSPAYIMDTFQKVAAESWNSRDNDSYDDHDYIKNKDEKLQERETRSIDEVEARVHKSALEDLKNRALKDKKC